MCHFICHTLNINLQIPNTNFSEKCLFCILEVNIECVAYNITYLAQIMNHKNEIFIKQGIKQGPIQGNYIGPMVCLWFAASMFGHQTGLWQTLHCTTSPPGDLTHGEKHNRMNLDRINQKGQPKENIYIYIYKNTRNFKPYPDCFSLLFVDLSNQG